MSGNIKNDERTRRDLFFMLGARYDDKNVIFDSRVDSKIKIEGESWRHRPYAEGFYSNKDIDDIYRLQGGIRYYCGCKISKNLAAKNQFEIDHIIPIALHGTDWPDNLAMACRKCNLEKGWRSVADYLRIKNKTNASQTSEK